MKENCTQMIIIVFFFFIICFFLILVCEEITRRESGWWDTDTCYISMATRDAPNHPRSSESNFWPDLVWHNNSRDYWTGESLLVYEGKITKLSIQFSYTERFCHVLMSRYQFSYFLLVFVCFWFFGSFFFGLGWLSIYLTNSIQGMTWKTQSPEKLSTEPLNWSWRMDQGNVSVKWGVWKTLRILNNSTYSPR